MVDPLTVWLIVGASVAVGALLGVLFERTRGAAAQRAAKFEADLVQARSELMHYQDQTKHHFGKSAELLGQMAKDYREFVDHFITGAQVLCGPNLKELSASGLEPQLLVGNGAAATAPVAEPAVAVATARPEEAPTPIVPTAAAVFPTAAAPLQPAAPRVDTTVAPLVPPPGVLDADPFVEHVDK